MTPMSIKFLRGMAFGNEYKTDTYTSNILRDATNKDLNLVGKINFEIFNIPQWLPPNVRINIKLQLAPSNFILRKAVGAALDVTVSITSVILYVRKQQVMSCDALVIEKLRAMEIISIARTSYIHKSATQY